MVITNEQLQTLKNYARNPTQNNTSVWLYVAEIIELDEETAVFGVIQELRSIENCTPETLAKYQDIIAYEMYRKIEAKHGKDVLSQIQQAIKHANAA